jgi:hypothetical protein
MNVTITDIPFKIKSTNIKRTEFIKSSIEYLQDYEDVQKVLKAKKEKKQSAISLDEYLKTHNA